MPKIVTSLRSPSSASLRPSSTALSEETLQPWRAVGNTMTDLTGPRFEPQTSRSIEERVTARPTGRFKFRYGAPFQQRKISKHENKFFFFSLAV